MRQLIPFDSPALDSDAAYRRIRDLVSSGAFEPNVALSERSLAERLGYSRTPVREALKRLALDGLLHVVPTRGTFLRVPTLEEVREIYEVRVALEGMAAFLAAERGPTLALHAICDRLRTLAAQGEAADTDAIQHIGWDFHDELMCSARNARLAAVHKSVQLPMVTLRSARPIRPARIFETAIEHLQIYDAIAASDGDLARNLISDHLTKALVARVEIFGMLPTRRKA